MKSLPFFRYSILPRFQFEPNVILLRMVYCSTAGLFRDFIRLEKKFWKIEHANDLNVHGYFSVSRRSILMWFSTICSIVFSHQVKNSISRFGVSYYWLSAWKLSERFTTWYDLFVQTLMLPPCCMENGQKGVDELPTRKIYLKLGTILVWIYLV